MKNINKQQSVVLCFKIFLLLILSSTLFLSCKFGVNQVFWREYGVSGRSKEIKTLSAPSTTSGVLNYDCVIITDVHFGATGDSHVQKFLEKIDNLSEKPSFCIVLGDVAEHGFESEYKQYAELLQSKLIERNIPVYGIVGNHDLYNSGYKQWRTYVEPKTPYYRFYTSSFSWYFIDTGNGTLGKPQLTNLLETLNKDSRPKIVLSHYPIYGDDIFYFVLSNTSERAQLLTAFAENNVKIIFTGHYHPGGVYNYPSFVEYGVKGFHDYGSAVILHVNETTQTVTTESISF